jgi:lipopolysaccharide/colanic/teichoic acid biosynthesis glycosyltransferase
VSSPAQPDAEGVPAADTSPSTDAGATPPGPEPQYYGRRKKRGTEICQILIRNGDVSPKKVRQALRIQEERGGQIGRILVAMGACSERAISRALIQQLQLRGNAEANLSVAARQNPRIAGLHVPCSPFRTTLTLVTADAAALALAVLAALAVNFLRPWVPRLESIRLIASAVVLCFACFPAMGLYAPAADSPPEQLRSSTLAVSLSVVGVAAVAIFGDRATRLWTLLTLFTFWMSAATFVPVSRAVIRKAFSRRAWWGHPVVVLGAARTGRLIVRTLQAQPERGLRPVFMLDDDPAKQGTLRASLTSERESVEVRSMIGSALDLISPQLLAAAAADLGLDTTASHKAVPPPSEGERHTSSPPRALDSSPPSLRTSAPPVRARGMFAEVEGVPVVGDLSLAPVLSQRLKIRYAILAMPGLDSQKLLRLSEQVGGFFTHMLIIPDLFGFGSLGVPARDIGGVLGLEVQQRLLLPWSRFAKRALDVGLTVFGGLCILPLLLLIATLIKLDSRGPILYWQPRLGRDGRHFPAAKFRSMYGDGEARLQKLLESDPKLKAEYEEFHKLARDPRITRIGRILRKYSLDELPQLLSVLSGDMSLVGPRPYLEREVKDMEGLEIVILRATPGMTGMWQVSDRNTTGFSERLKMDVHYVRNWSPWLDIYILARTFEVVIRGTGV